MRSPATFLATFLLGYPSRAASWTATWTRPIATATLALLPGRLEDLPHGHHQRRSSLGLRRSDLRTVQSAGARLRFRSGQPHRFPRAGPVAEGRPALCRPTAARNREAFNRDWNNIQPRIGVAWQVTPKWVVRGGYGLYYLGQNAAGADTGFSRQTAMITSTDNNLTPAANLSDPFPRALCSRPGCCSRSALRRAWRPTSAWAWRRAVTLDRPLPKSHQFSFGFQRTLGQTLAG